MLRNWCYITLAVLLLGFSHVRAEDGDLPTETVEDDIAAHKEGSRTDSETVDREAEAIKIDGLSVAEMKLMRESAEKHVFQAEVNRMMKLIINSLYRNKEERFCVSGFVQNKILMMYNLLQISISKSFKLKSQVFHELFLLHRYCYHKD